MQSFGLGISCTAQVFETHATNAWDFNLFSLSMGLLSRKSHEKDRQTLTFKAIQLPTQKLLLDVRIHPSIFPLKMGSSAFMEFPKI